MLIHFVRELQAIDTPYAVNCACLGTKGQKLYTTFCLLAMPNRKNKCNEKNKELGYNAPLFL